MIAWNEFLFALLFLVEHREKWTVSLGLSQLSGSIEVPTTVLMAGSVILTMPIIVLFFLSERLLAGGLTAGAEKGELTQPPLAPERPRRPVGAPSRGTRHARQEDNCARLVSFAAPAQGRAGPVRGRSPRPRLRADRTWYSGISAGTELTAYRGSNPYLTSTWDPDRRPSSKASQPSATPSRAGGTPRSAR